MSSRILAAAFLGLIAGAPVFAQNAPDAGDDVNKQQIVPDLSEIPKPDKGYGTVYGQFVFDGDVPKPELMFAKGSPDVKDAATCAAVDQYKNDLVVNEKNKGIQNIFIYLKKAKSIHPDLKASKTEKVWFDQKNCRFYPKALVVRTDQKVMVVSSDPVAHNTHTFPIRNQGVNILVAPRDRAGNPITNPKAELLPIEVKCDLHPWMKAHWLILDHPYMAVSNKDGRFVIGNLPAGKHELRIWQERVGYVHKKMPGGKFYVTVKSGEVTDVSDSLKLKADWFKN